MKMLNGNTPPIKKSKLKKNSSPDWFVPIYVPM
jgi:hypothetical protein